VLSETTSRGLCGLLKNPNFRLNKYGALHCAGHLPSEDPSLPILSYSMMAGDHSESSAQTDDARRTLTMRRTARLLEFFQNSKVSF